MEEFSEDSGLYNLNFLHDLPNSHGWVADAATDLHEDLGKLSWAGAATVEEFSEDSGSYNLNFLHDLPNSHGWVADAATDLHEDLGSFHGLVLRLWRSSLRILVCTI